MPKQTTSLPLALPPRRPGVAAGQWLYDVLRAAILEGRLRPGSRLPASRDLARHQGLARGTVVGAFEQLRAEGYVEAAVGSGTYVTRVLPDRGPAPAPALRPAAPPPRPAPEPPPAGGERRFAAYGRRVSEFQNLQAGPLRAFRANLPALDLFPTALWAQVAARRLRRATAQLLLSCEPLGYRPLQEAIADYLTTSRGVRCRAEQIAVVSGTQAALDLVARLLIDPGDRVAIENPGYPGARLVFAAHGASLVPVPLDDEGIELDAATLAGVRLAYVTPAHQFPLGGSMSLPRRLALLDWARGTGAAILEDDYDSEFRYAGRPLPALQGLDRDDRVLFAGSFSKVLFPSLRLGYLVLPPDLLDRCAATLSITQRHAPLLDQAVLADFIAAGHFGRHVRRMREVYAERLALLLAQGAARLAGLLDISDVEAGLQTVGWVRGGPDGEAAAAAAARRNVEVTALARYGEGGVAREALQLGFAAVDAREIRRGVEDLAVALESLARPPATGQRSAW
jgi:GntR family transcriptional regulator/MocR family aminotransferase